MACLVVLLALAVIPRSGAAQNGLGYTSVRSNIQGFASLFRSPPPQVVRLPSTPALPTSSPSATPFRPQPAIALGTNPGGGICRPAIVAAEMRHGIPAGLLQAIGIVESGRRDPATGKSEPWPWTINADGEPHIFDNKQQAVDWVRQAQQRGVQSIDVGCAQVNLMYHPSAFASLDQAFDPAANADYAARFLRELRETTAAGDWMTAAGHYHSRTPELADIYREQVKVAMARASSVPPTPVIASASAPIGSIGPISPLASAGSLRSPPANILPATAGTVGRGLDAYRAMPVRMALAVPPHPVGTR